MEWVKIIRDGKTETYKSMAEASRALGKKSGFLKRRRECFGNRFLCCGASVVIDGNEKPDKQKEAAFCKIFEEAKQRAETNPKGKKETKKDCPKDGKSLFAIVREIDEYNRAHGTGLSYGEYMNRGLNVERTTAP